VDAVHVVSVQVRNDGGRGDGHGRLTSYDAVDLLPVCLVDLPLAHTVDLRVDDVAATNVVDSENRRACVVPLQAGVVVLASREETNDSVELTVQLSRVQLCAVHESCVSTDGCHCFSLSV
jgi:hypothetical protein